MAAGRPPVSGWQLALDDQMTGRIVPPTARPHRQTQADRTAARGRDPPGTPDPSHEGRSTARSPTRARCTSPSTTRSQTIAAGTTGCCPGRLRDRPRRHRLARDVQDVGGRPGRPHVPSGHGGLHDGQLRFGATREETLVVEDSSRGLNSAVAAGIDCVIVANDFTKTQDFRRLAIASRR